MKKIRYLARRVFYIFQIGLKKHPNMLIKTLIIGLFFLHYINWFVQIKLSSRITSH